MCPVDVVQWRTRARHGAVHRSSPTRGREEKTGQAGRGEKNSIFNIEAEWVKKSAMRHGATWLPSRGRQSRRVHRGEQPRGRVGAAPRAPRARLSMNMMNLWK